MVDALTLIHLGAWLILSVEFCCLLLYGIHFFKNESRLEPAMHWLLLSTIGLHALFLVARGLYFQRHPMGTAFEAVFAYAFVVSLLYTYIEKHINVRDTGLLVLGVAFLLRLAALLFCDVTADIASPISNRWFAYHSAFAIIGCAALMIAAIYGGLYLVLYWQLKRSRFTRIFDRLPSLEVLNEMNIHAAWYGFLFFTASLIFGMRWWKLEYGVYFSPDPKIIMGYLTVGVFAVEMVGYHYAGWSGKRLAYLSLLGFSLILFSATVVNWFFSTLHGV
jgi:ABC-type transport system involved in cytochrome c biogenesis permease subunit